MRNVRALVALLCASAAGLPTPSFADRPAHPVAQTPTQFDNELTVWVIPAPRPAELSWRTPGGLIRRVVTNAVGGMLHIMNRKLGHMGVTVRCGQQEWTGSMTNSIDAEFQDIVVKKGYGLGVLFHNFSGAIEPAADMYKSINERYRTGRITWVRSGISAQTCGRLMTWVSEFQKAGVDKFYGLAAQPRYREGAGCSAFSMSFLEQAGLLEPAYMPWSFDLRAPMKLIGGPLTGKRWPIARAMTITRGWAAENEPHKRIFGWDPTLGFYWVHNNVKRIERGQRVFSTPATVERRGHAVGLVLDRRNVPTPTEPFFKN